MECVRIDQTFSFAISVLQGNWLSLLIIVASAETLHVVLFKIIDENVYRENESTRDMIIHYSLDPL